MGYWKSDYNYDMNNKQIDAFAKRYKYRLPVEHKPLYDLINSIMLWYSRKSERKNKSGYRAPLIRTDEIVKDLKQRGFIVTVQDRKRIIQERKEILWNWNW